MKNISLKKVKSGFVIKTAVNTSFGDLYDYFKKNINEYSEILKSIEIVGVDKVEMTENEKTIFKKLFKDVLEKDIKSLEYFDLAKYYERAEKKASKSEYERQLYKDFDKYLTYGKENKSTDEEVVSKVAQEIMESLDENSRMGLNLDLETDLVVNDEKENLPTVFHRGTIRSGTCINSEGHIVVIGDVNMGAELFARGNIVVMGSLKGLSHAGCEGDNDAFITAFKLLSEQIRISSFIGLTKDIDIEISDSPKIILIEDDKIIVKKYI